MADDGRIRRALLFIPGDDRHKIEKGARLGVDAVILDLEDAVALNRKQAARDTVQTALQDPTLNFGRTERLVRINPHETGWQEEDVKATLPGRPDGYVIPKVESALEVQRVAQILLDGEHAHDIESGTTRLIAIVETARGIVNLKDIAEASERLVALAFGAEDLAGSLGAVRTTNSNEVFYARSALVLHAAAFNLQAIDTPYVDYTDLEGLRVDTRTGMQMGYSGRLAIHPAQVGAIVDVFTPTPDEVERAKALIAAYQAQQASGVGVFSYKGKMVDQPMIRAAEWVLARASPGGND
jgi:citrate lyase beta subunit